MLAPPQVSRIVISEVSAAADGLGNKGNLLHQPRTTVIYTSRQDHMHTQSLERIVFAVFHHLNQNWSERPLEFT
jgi:hypothetical protein